MENTPCGRCDIGVYSELAILNIKARKFSAMSRKERCKNMPMCKSDNHVCYGAKDLHNLILMIDESLGECDV